MITQRFAYPVISPRPQPGLRGVAIVLAAVQAILVDQTTSAIVNTGLPYLQAITTATPDEASWIITVFNAAYYAAILLSPWMMARFGRRSLMVTALTSFSIVSVLLYFTTAFPLFVVLRFVQGACLGCVFVPAAVLLFTSLAPGALKFAPPAFVFVSLAGSTLGTAIGGYVADEYGGSAVFIPGAAATLVTAILIVLAVRPTDVQQTDLRFDAAGVAVSVLMFGAMQYLVNEGQRRNWFDDPAIVAGAVVLAVAAPAFVLYELFATPEPHVNFRMFSEHRNLSVGAMINIAIGSVGYSVTIFVAYLQSALGATPTLAGSMVIVRVCTYAVGVPAAFALIASRWLDMRVVVVIGVIGSSLALLAFSELMTVTADIQTFVGVSLLFGLFFGMLNAPMGALVIGSMPLPLLAAGVSIYKLSSPVGLMIATGAVQKLLNDRTVAFGSRLAGEVARGRPPIDRYVQAHHGASGLVAIVGAQAQTLAYASLMTLFASIVLLVIPLVFFAKIQRPQAVVKG